MSYWILKTEPSTYSYADLEREKKTVWDGVKNPFALRNMAQMKPGDAVLIYHTGGEKAVVGRAEVVASDPKLTVVELVPKGKLPRPVTLAQIKADKTFADSALVRQGRLSVVAATPAHWKRLLELAGV